MITEESRARAVQTIAAGLDDAVMQGWGPEAASLLQPVRVALDSAFHHEALAVITEQLARATADACSARGLYLAGILRTVQADLAVACEAKSTDMVAAYASRVYATESCFIREDPIKRVKVRNAHPD